MDVGQVGFHNPKLVRDHHIFSVHYFYSRIMCICFCMYLDKLYMLYMAVDQNV